jgi:hypothetical protein
MVRVKHQTPWVTEEWTCKFTNVNAPYEDFNFSISGSVTGNDGLGIASKDFVSPSGRVIIDKGDAEKDGDWHLNRSYKVLKTTVSEGDEVKWKTFSISMDTLQNTSFGGLQTLFQGVPNTSHILNIDTQGESDLYIDKIIVYRPFLRR